MIVFSVYLTIPYKQNLKLSVKARHLAKNTVCTGSQTEPYDQLAVSVSMMLIFYGQATQAYSKLTSKKVKAVCEYKANLLL